MAVSENHISRAGKASIEDRYGLKLAILGQWIRDGIPWRRASSGEILCDETGARLLEYVPTDVKSLTAWDGSRNTPNLEVKLKSEADGVQVISLQSLVGNQSKTISTKQHNQLRKKCEEIIKAIAAKAESQHQQENHGDEIEGLKLQIKSLEKLVAVQEKDVCDLRIEQKSWRDALSKSERIQMDNLVEARRLLAEKNVEVEALKLENATLKRERANVVPFSVV
jgi:hypothetical protein